MGSSPPRRGRWARENEECDRGSFEGPRTLFLVFGPQPDRWLKKCGRVSGEASKGGGTES